MFDMPPPSTMTSGSSRLITCASASREAVLVAGERGPARGVAQRRARRDLVRREGFAASPAGDRARGRRRTRRSRCIRARPQKHGGPGPLVVARPRQRVVPPFARDRVGTLEHAPVHDDAGADAGAEDRAEDHAGALARAVGRLRQREAVGVVGDADLAVERGLEVALDRLAVEAHGVRATQEAGRARDRARRADADHAARRPARARRRGRGGASAAIVAP